MSSSLSLTPEWDINNFYIRPEKIKDKRYVHIYPCWIQEKLGEAMLAEDFEKILDRDSGFEEFINSYFKYSCINPKNKMIKICKLPSQYSKEKIKKFFGINNYLFIPCNLSCGFCRWKDERPGFTKEDKVFKLNIDNLNASMQSGDYVLDNQGGHESKYSNGRDGQLIGRIIINTGNYKVDQSNNVFEQVEIPYYDMLLGTDKDVILPNGKKITVKIPSESKDGNVVKSTKNGINGGDYYLCIKAKFPSLNKNDKELLKKIKNNHS